MNTGKNKKKKGEKEARRKKERKENSFSKLFYLNVDFSQNQLLTLSKVLEILVQTFFTLPQHQEFQGIPNLTAEVCIYVCVCEDAGMVNVLG